MSPYRERPRHFLEVIDVVVVGDDIVLPWGSDIQAHVVVPLDTSAAHLCSLLAQCWWRAGHKKVVLLVSNGQSSAGATLLHLRRPSSKGLDRDLRS
jgi:hypothetical protein